MYTYTYICASTGVSKNLKAKKWSHKGLAGGCRVCGAYLISAPQWAPGQWTTLSTHVHHTAYCKYIYIPHICVYVCRTMRRERCSVRRKAVSGCYVFEVLLLAGQTSIRMYSQQQVLLAVPTWISAVQHQHSRGPVQADKHIARKIPAAPLSQSPFPKRAMRRPEGPGAWWDHGGRPVPEQLLRTTPGRLWDTLPATRQIHDDMPVISSQIC